MVPAIVTLLILWCGWRAYRNARRDGTWSNKQFLVALLGALGLCAVILFPIIFISPMTMEAHEGLALVSILLAIFVGVTLLTIYLNRWRKRDLLKRSGQNRTV
jgi:magnesium-transporting ATPase (P-type)